MLYRVDKNDDEQQGPSHKQSDISDVYEHQLKSQLLQSDNEPEVVKFATAPAYNEIANGELDEKKVLSMAKSIFSVSDSVIAPKPFTGKNGEGDAESWLEFFELYCKHRGLTPFEQLTLFPLLMREGAADWIATLSKQAFRSYDSLVTAFRDNYFVPVELRWKETGLLWNQAQRDDERVEDFVTRIRRGARRINMGEAQLTGIVLNGLRPTIRMHVLQKGGDTLNDLVKTAKLAEAVAPPSNDTTNALLLKVIQANAQANEKQTTEMKRLTAKIAALTEPNDGNIVNAVDRERASDQRVTAQRSFRRPTPQIQQRDNYARNFNTRTPAGGAAGFLQDDQRNNRAAMGTECGRCGYQHAVGRCRAIGLDCKNCGKIGHFARMCRSARPQQPQQPPLQH
jgi:hypothetical protein